MIYTHLFDRTTQSDPVRAGVIGTGQYATAIVTQAQHMSRLSVPVVADADPAAAREAYRRAGVADDDVVVCESRAAAVRALERGKRAVLADAMDMMDLPLDVIVESTGSAEAGARHAHAAIDHGKHVAMVNKEADATVGPILKHLADRAGVVYTQVDGDQHGLLIGLVLWARELGLEVVCGGKARDVGVQWDPAARGVLRGDGATDVTDPEAFDVIGSGDVADALDRRRSALGTLADIGSFDVEELAIAANATGLLPDVERLHAPVVRTSEIPDALCPVEDGGILARRGVVDMVTCLRSPGDPGLGGGVFVVVGCANDYSRHILLDKGLVPNRAGTAGLIYRPYHLCGVETPMSILCAALLGVPTGAHEYAPRVDVVVEAAADLAAGDVEAALGAGSRISHSRKLRALMEPARPVREGAPLPLEMLPEAELVTNVPAGTVITADMVRPTRDSTLWSLRARQDAHFLS